MMIWKKGEILLENMPFEKKENFLKKEIEEWW